MAEWLRRLTSKPKVRTDVCSNPALDILVAVRNSIPGRPEPCEGNLVAAAGSCGGLFFSFSFIIFLSTVAPSICIDCFTGGRAKIHMIYKFKT